MVTETLNLKNKAGVNASFATVPHLQILTLTLFIFLPNKYDT